METLVQLSGGLALLLGGLWFYVEPLAYLLGRPTPRFSVLLAMGCLLFLVLWERGRRGSAASHSGVQRG